MVIITDPFHPHNTSAAIQVFAKKQKKVSKRTKMLQNFQALQNGSSDNRKELSQLPKKKSWGGLSALAVEWPLNQLDQREPINLQ